MRNASVAAGRFVAEVAAVLVSVCAVCAGLLWLALWLLGIVFVWLPRLFLRTAVLGAVLAAAGCATMANGAVHRADVVGDGPAAVLQVHHRGRVRPDGPAHPDGAPVAVLAVRLVPAVLDARMDARMGFRSRLRRSSGAVSSGSRRGVSRAGRAHRSGVGGSAWEVSPQPGSSA